MSQEEHYRKLENLMHSAPIVGLTGARARIGEGEARIDLQVRKEFHHAAGAMHGAIYFLLLDNAAFFAANSLVTDVFVLTSSFTVYFLRPVTRGSVQAVGRVVHSGSSQMIAESVAHDDRGRQVGRGSGVFVRSGQELTPQMGYE